MTVYLENSPVWGSALPEVLTPYAALEITGPVRYALGVTADPFREPELFENQINWANPRYRGDDVPFENRYMLESDSGSYRPFVERHIMTAAGGLAMLNGEIGFVDGSQFDGAIALGAARKALEGRTRYLVGAVQTGTITADVIGTLTSGREINDAEVNAAGLTPEDMVYNLAGIPIEHSLGRGAVRVMHADSPETGRRLLRVEVDDPLADTVATVKAAVQQLEIPPGGSIAGVTQSIYYAKQGLQMRQAGLETDTRTAIAGIASDKSIVANRTGATYAAEVLVTARAAQRLILAEREAE